MVEEKQRISQSQQPYPYYPDDEIDLSDLFGVLWRRKMIIILTTICITALALIFCLISTKKYLISAQITPGVTNYNNKGDPIRLMTTNDLKGWFDKEAYLAVLKGIMNEEELRRVKIDASAPQGSNVASLEFYWPDKKNGEKILSTVIASLGSISSARLEKTLGLSRSTIDQAIKIRRNNLKHLEIEEQRLEREIQLKKADLELAEDKVKAVEQKIGRTKALIDDLSKEVQHINLNTDELVRLRNALAKRPRADKLAVLMYTNIIQQNLSYSTQLKGKITALKKNIIDLEMSKKTKENNLKKIEDAIKRLQVKKDQELPLQREGLKTQIETLTAKKAALSPIEVVQAPFSSLRPVKPKTAMIVAVGIVLGVFVGIFLAFIWEFISNNREKITGRKAGMGEIRS